jgi:hypothetical protein
MLPAAGKKNPAMRGFFADMSVLPPGGVMQPALLDWLDRFRCLWFASAPGAMHAEPVAGMNNGDLQ